jgi:hypothetical protein
MSADSSVGQSSRVKRSAWRGARGILLTLAAAGIACTQPQKKPPLRPPGVSPAAVLIPSDARRAGASNLKRSDWLDCSRDSRRLSNRCRILDADGKLEYEDTFLPYEAFGPIPINHLPTNVGAEAVRIAWHRFGKREFPVILLRGGTTLVPLAAYSGDPRHEDE